VIPFLIAFFSAWSGTILYLKSRKLRLQSRTLDLQLVPTAHDFVLASDTAKAVLSHMYECVDHPSRFILLSRIERALSNLSNIGRVSDVNEMLQAQASNDEDQMESSYTIVRGFVWGVPVLGFIGTVLGLSTAMAGFGDLISGGGSIDALKSSLMNVTAGLATAFENTLEGLVSALTIQLALTALKKREERFLDDCKDYCHSNIISRLRLIHLDDYAAPVEQGET
jgi:biopolymer transport protein ExbB/TolQ